MMDHIEVSPYQYTYFRGAQRVLTAPDATAGQEYSYTVPSGARLLPYSISLTFTTTGSAPTRTSSLKFIRGGKTLVWAPWAAAFQPTTVNSLICYAAYPAIYTNGPLLLALTTMPPFILLPGTQITTATASLDPGDRYTAFSIFADEIYDDDIGNVETRKLTDTLESLSHHPEFAHIG